MLRGHVCIPWLCRDRYKGLPLITPYKELKGKREDICWKEVQQKVQFNKYQLSIIIGKKLFASCVEKVWQDVEEFKLHDMCRNT